MFPYAFRHTFAQRHADAGTPVDTLKELLGHDTVRTTLGYYRVTAKRTRDAQDRLGPLQIDARGHRVRPGATALTDTDAARDQIGQVAVPFGICTEPSNVTAGGHSCPFRHRCTGCTYFRTDPSYTPSSAATSHSLLADRERLVAAIPALADWARADAAPSEAEIDAVRQTVCAPTTKYSPDFTPTTAPPSRRPSPPSAPSGQHWTSPSGRTSRPGPPTPAGLLPHHRTANHQRRDPTWLNAPRPHTPAD